MANNRKVIFDECSPRCSEPSFIKDVRNRPGREKKCHYSVEFAVTFRAARCPISAYGNVATFLHSVKMPTIQTVTTRRGGGTQSPQPRGLSLLLPLPISDLPVTSFDWVAKAQLDITLEQDSKHTIKDDCALLRPPAPPTTPDGQAALCGKFKGPRIGTAK